MDRLKKRILIVLIAIILNVAGRYLAFSYEWPMYFNLCGTILAAYVEGPVIGTVSAVLGCAFCMIFSFNDWYFLIADIFVAVAVGIITKKNRFFKKFSLIYSATAFFTIVRAIILLMINLNVNAGKSGLYIVDAIFDYLDSISLPMWLGYMLVALFVSFADVLAAMLLNFFVLRIYKGFGKKKKANELKKELMKKVSFGLVFMFIFAGVKEYTSAFADNSISFIEKLYNSDNGLTGGCVNDVAMTKDGSMWIATYGGLLRFNGYRFVLIDNLNSVRSVQTLFVDGDDRLWAGTQDSGVTLLNIDMSWVTLDMDMGLPSNSVKCISRDSNGLYYFGTTGGIVTAEYDNGNVNIVKVDTKAGNIRDLSPDSKGHMIVMNNLGDISCYENGEAVATLEIEHAYAKGINHDAKDKLYIGADSGKILIYYYDSDGFHAGETIMAEGLKTIRDFYFDDNDTIYVAADNAIGYLDKNRHLTLIESGEFNNSIDHIFKDYQGNLWFTSSRCGLLCLGKSCFTDVFRLCNEKSIVCNAIKQWNGYLYVGSNDGLKILDVKNGKSIKNATTDEFEGIRIRSLDIDLSGNLLVATYDKGIMELTLSGEASSYVSTDETERMIRVVKVLSDGTVVSSSDAGLVFMKDHKVLGKLNLGADLAGGSILNILETNDHTLFCGTDGDGIAIIKEGKFDRYITRENGLPSGVILRIVKDKNGEGYFVLTGSGLCYLDANLNISDIGMPYYNNFDIAVNSEGELFVLGGAGIYICEYDTLMKERKMVNYTLLDTKAGLPGSITSNAWNYVTDDEFIYICGSSGVYQLNLRNYEMKVEDFKTKITSITRNGVYEDVTQVGTIFIPKDTERIELSLEINNYTTADPLVSFYMSGVDYEKVTVSASKLSSVTYYDIPYGNHDFVISVLDEKGRELSKQTYIFSKERELFETLGFSLYFYLMLFAFIVCIVISIVQGALWSQRKRETGRHELVISQLEREKTEALERALHMEENANKSKSEFLANMSHEIKTPINAIIGMDTMIMRESNEENIRNYARDIDLAGKKLITLINNIHEFSMSGKTENMTEIKVEEKEPEEEKIEKENTTVRSELFHAPDAKIMVVDDVEMNLTVAKNLLKRIKVQVDTARNGEEAISLALDNQYDLILLDSTIQGLNGEDTMQNIRKQCSANSDTPIIVLASNAVEGAREEYLNLGYSNYLSKPIDGIKLEAMIQSYLPDEKIIFVDEDQADKDINSERERMISLISKIEGIDVTAGIETAGGEDSYIVICRSFHDMAKKRIKHIKEAFEKEKYDDYSSVVYELVNSARLIGASELSKQAHELENAGREGDIALIKEKTDDILKKYQYFYDRFDRLFKK
ncbi:MAG: response regulator [Lachnospiraceae bacterium]|nr:response regulator [Lachnospiraceae bacterium]